jgi:zinc transporter, ZIP family
VKNSDSRRMELSNFWVAVLLTSFAGLSTGIGSLLAFFTKKTNTNFLSVSLGFSAGVMIYISFVELFSHAQKIFSNSLGEIGTWICVVSFFLGFGIIALIDKLIPSYENPHEMHEVEELKNKERAQNFRKLYRVGILMAMAISIHNFPEGLVTFLGTLTSLKLGLAIAIAIAIHNIPEGIAVSVPIFYATGSKKKAFIWSFLSGLAEPIGGILGFLILRPFINDTLIGVMFALIAGIMVFISFDTLLPAAEKYGKHHLSILGLVSGMIVMGISLLLF